MATDLSIAPALTLWLQVPIRIRTKRVSITHMGPEDHQLPLLIDNLFGSLILSVALATSHKQYLAGNLYSKLSRSSNETLSIQPTRSVRSRLTLQMNSGLSPPLEILIDRLHKDLHMLCWARQVPRRPSTYSHAYRTRLSRIGFFSFLSSLESRVYRCLRNSSSPRLSDNLRSTLLDKRSLSYGDHVVSASMYKYLKGPISRSA